MKERIQKILSARGITSRRQAEAWISAGRVTCNGLVCKLGDSAEVDIDEILLDGMPIPSKTENVYIMLNKPRGYVTTLSDEKGRKNAAQLVADCGKRVYPIGRLDMDSEGLLLFTNDGELANKLMHPKHLVNKGYEVWVKGFSADSLENVGRRIELDGYRIEKPQITLLHDEGTEAKLLIIIHEGRNRQIRRMCAAAGMSVHRLIRVSEGPLELTGLKPGTWRYLTDEEVNALGR